MRARPKEGEAMKILRSGAKAALIGFVVICILQFLHILPMFYCFIVYIVGVLAAYIYLREAQVMSLPHIVSASLVASLLTIGGAWLRSVLIDILSSGASMDFLGMIPMDLFIPEFLLIATVFGVIGALGGANLLDLQKKHQGQVADDGPDQNGERNLPHPVWFILLGGGGLSLLIIGGIALFIALLDANQSIGEVKDLMDLLPDVLLFTFIPGAIAGLFVYAGRYIGARGPASENRILQRLLVIVGISLFVWVCMFSALYFLMLGM
jgi:hypothetical protein